MEAIMSNNSSTARVNVVLRTAEPADRRRLRRLAGRDTSGIPGGPLLVAEQDGVVLAAWSEAEGRAIADPFRPTGPLVELLRRAGGLSRVAGG
jgi:hypothetical protein